jgi:hypothetical protein
LAVLVRDHGIPDDLQPAPFALGAAGIAGPAGWLLLDERPQRGLGPALAWAARAGVDRLHVLAGRDTGTLTRRAAAFRFPIEVWHVDDRTLLAAIAEPLPVPAAVPAEHQRHRQLIADGGAVPVEEHGCLVGEVGGLEVCRVVTDRYTGEVRLEVGIGEHDREAFQMLHGDVPTAEALASIVAAVAPHRRFGADPHPLNRIARERALRLRLIECPELVGASQVEAAEAPLPRPNLKDTFPCVARAVIHGRATTLVISCGVDLDLVPFAVDARLAAGHDCLLVMPHRDAVRVQFDIAALLDQPMPIVPVG